MFDFYDKIIGFFETLGQFLWNMIEGLLLAIRVLSTGLAFPAMISAFVPAIIFSSTLIVITFAVIKFLLGR